MIETHSAALRHASDMPRYRRLIDDTSEHTLSAWQAAAMTGQGISDLLGAAGCLVAEMPLRLVSLAFLGTSKHPGLFGSLATPLNATCRLGGRMVGGLAGLSSLPVAVARGESSRAHVDAWQQWGAQRGEGAARGALLGARYCAGGVARAAGAAGSLSGRALGLVVRAPLAALVGVAMGLKTISIIVPPDLPVSPALRESRNQAKRAYEAALPLPQRWSLRVRDAAARVPSAAAILSGILHPQIHADPYDVSTVDLQDVEPSGRLQYARSRLPFPDHDALVRRLDIFTDDHVQLDAALVAPGAPDPNSPTLVVSMGNAERYESSLAEAVRWADTYGLQVLLWNGRGIGESRGRECNTSDEVSDSKAVLRYAVDHFTQLHAYGRSLGGSVLVTSLAELVESGELPQERVLTAIADNSFRDVPTVAACLASATVPRQRWLGRVFRTVLMALDMNPLDAGRALRDTPIAASVVLSNVDDDPIIRGQAALSDAADTANEVVRHQSASGGHGNYLVKAPSFESWLREMSPR